MTVVELGRGFLDFRETQGIDSAVAHLVLHKAEALCVIRVFGGLVVRVLFGFLFGSENLTHVLQVAADQQLLQLLVLNLFRKRLVDFELADLARQLRCVDEHPITLIDRQVFVRKGTGVVELSEVLLDAGGLVADLCAEDLNISACSIGVIRQALLRDVVNGGGLFLLGCWGRRSSLGVRLGGRFTATCQAQDQETD